MNKLSLPGFQRAIKAVHGVYSIFVRRVHVVEHGESAIWKGDVLVFDLLGHPRAGRCYTWESKGEVTAILHDHVVASPQEAVRIALSAQPASRRAEPLARDEAQAPQALAREPVLSS
jgi:hypothetical protein